MLLTTIAAHISKMVEDAGEDCMAKSCLAAARLSDVVRGVKDDCKIQISLVAVHVIYVVMACNHCFSSAKFSYLTFSSASAIGDALSYNDYT
jgi:hypothetical protein